MQSSSELTERILAEIGVAAPEAFPRSHSRRREQLRKRIQQLLSDAGYPPAEPERCAVTILLADIRGFMSLTESYTATVVVNMLNRYLALMSEIIVGYGGTIDKLMGDSIMALFGAPLRQHDHVERALACAVEMQQAMSRFNQQNEALGLPPLYIGIGINSGEVVAGSIGSHLHREYTVIGAEVNLAARIEAQSLRGQVLLGENTYRLAREYILVGEPNRVQVKGRRAPVMLYELLGTTRPRSLTVPRREVRKSPRIEIRMPCYFQRLEGKRVMDQVHCGQVMDVGYHGLRMLSPVPLATSSEIKMDLSLQLWGQRTSPVYARILNGAADTEGYRCSIEFTDIDRIGELTIKRFVDNQIGAL
jgi:adenylate cyclase